MIDSMLDLSLGWEGDSLGRRGRSPVVPRGFGAMDTRSIKRTECDGREPGHGREADKTMPLRVRLLVWFPLKARKSLQFAHIRGIWGKSYQLCDKVHTT